MATRDRRHERHSHKRIAALLVGGLLVLVMCVPLLVVLLHPIKSRPSWNVVTTLNRIPLNGEPKSFDVTLSRSDAWETAAPELLGSIYLRREQGTEKVIALSPVSPWLGCRVVYDAERKSFLCRCHPREEFDRDGQRIGSNPAPRDLDTFKVEVNDGKVLVEWLERAK